MKDISAQEELELLKQTLNDRFMETRLRVEGDSTPPKLAELCETSPSKIDGIDEMNNFNDFLRSNTPTAPISTPPRKAPQTPSAESPAFAPIPMGSAPLPYPQVTDSFQILDSPQPQQQLELVPCKFCKRSFIPVRLQKHESVCDKSKAIVVSSTHTPGRSSMSGVFASPKYSPRRGEGSPPGNATPTLDSTSKRRASAMGKDESPKRSVVAKEQSPTNANTISTMSMSVSSGMSLAERRAQKKRDPVVNNTPRKAWDESSSLILSLSERLQQQQTAKSGTVRKQSSSSPPQSPSRRSFISNRTVRSQPTREASPRRAQTSALGLSLSERRVLKREEMTQKKRSSEQRISNSSKESNEQSVEMAAKRMSHSSDRRSRTTSRGASATSNSRAASVEVESRSTTPTVVLPVESVPSPNSLSVSDQPDVTLPIAPEDENNISRLQITEIEPGTPATVLEADASVILLNANQEIIEVANDTFDQKTNDVGGGSPLRHCKEVVSSCLSSSSALTKLESARRRKKELSKTNTPTQGTNSDSLRQQVFQELESLTHTPRVSTRRVASPQRIVQKTVVGTPDKVIINNSSPVGTPSASRHTKSPATGESMRLRRVAHSTSRKPDITTRDSSRDTKRVSRQLSGFSTKTVGSNVTRTLSPTAGNTRRSPSSGTPSSSRVSIVKRVGVSSGGSPQATRDSPGRCRVLTSTMRGGCSLPSAGSVAINAGKDKDIKETKERKEDPKNVPVTSKRQFQHPQWNGSTSLPIRRVKENPVSSPTARSSVSTSDRKRLLTKVRPVSINTKEPKVAIPLSTSNNILNASTSSLDSLKGLDDTDKMARARACAEELRKLGFADAAAIVCIVYCCLFTLWVFGGGFFFFNRVNVFIFVAI